MTETAFDETKIDAIFAGLDQCHLPGAAVGIAMPFSGILLFDDEGGAFRFSNGRTKGLVFRRAT